MSRVGDNLQAHRTIAPVCASQTARNPCLIHYTDGEVEHWKFIMGVSTEAEQTAAAIKHDFRSAGRSCSGSIN